MNFLSHYFYFRKDNPYYHTGLVLPDFVKAFCKNRLHLKGSYVRPDFKHLSNGCMTHFESDRRFHESAFFRNVSGFIGSRLDHTAKWPRKWFLNHLLTEILLDRVLMDAEPDLCSDFYHQLSITDPGQVELFLKLSSVANYQQFTSGFNRFMDLRFMFDYKHNEKIILALSRVYGRLGIVYNWNDEDNRLLISHIPKIIQYIDQEKGLLHRELV